MVQVASCNKTVTTVVAGPSDDENASLSVRRVLSSNGAGHRQACKLDQLIHAEAEMPHELLINVDRLILTPGNSIAAGCTHVWPQIFSQSALTWKVPRQ